MDRLVLLTKTAFHLRQPFKMNQLLSRLRRKHPTSLLAKAMRKERTPLIRTLISERPGSRENRFEEPADIFEQRVGESVDLLIGHLEGRPHFDALYAGLRMFELHRPEASHDANLSAGRASADHDWIVLREVLEPHLCAGDLQELESAYWRAVAPLISQATKHVQTLLIGDCLMPEIMSFLVSPLLAEGISIDSFPINARDGGQLRKVLEGLKAKQYDVIFFSPFSHARLPELDALLEGSTSLRSNREIDELLDAVMFQTKGLIDMIADRFECPVYVHNASMTRRAGSVPKGVVGGLLSLRSRVRTKNRLNQWLSDTLEAKNEASFKHLFLLDEERLAQSIGRYRAGVYIHSSPFQHATALSQALAAEYQVRISTVARLLGKKLIVCDLDNTLWDGVIGDGPVAHYLDRQRVLKRLKDEGGIVLSIASKNDPSNVHFTNGLLAESDFVAPQISWNAKSKAISNIKTQLNLQIKHMVFLDDRPDERALVQESHPDMLVLDPTDAAVWRLLELWADLVVGSSDLDRTVLYQQQLERDRLAKPPDELGSGVDIEALTKLGLSITVSEASKGDLKRVTELINRTNQWNMCGSRTTFDQVRSWHQAQDAVILLGSAADRFGDMGTVCVAVMTMDGEAAQIPVFVLSCRVFGYGVETAVLREISSRCLAKQIHRLIGRYRETPQNHPGRDMYADHGFRKLAGDFEWDCTDPLPEIPWAVVHSK